MNLDRTTSLIIESGFLRFFNTFSEFLTDVQDHILSNAEDDEFRLLNLNDLRGPLTFCLYLISFAWLVFILEVIINKLKSRRN